MNTIGPHSKILHYLLLDLPHPNSPPECLQLLFDEQDIKPYAKVCLQSIVEGNPSSHERYFLDKYSYINAPTVKPARHLLTEAINRDYSVDTILREHEHSSIDGSLDQIFYHTLMRIRKETKSTRAPSFIATPKTSSLKSADLRILYSLLPLDSLGLHDRVVRCARYHR